MDYQNIKTLEVKPMRKQKEGKGLSETLTLLVFLMLGIYIIQGIIYALFI